MSDYWGKRAKAEASGQTISYGWLDAHWLVDWYIWPRIFGSAPGTTWGEMAANAFGLSKGKWLSLGCGTGNIEIQMAEAGLFDQMVAMDFSARSLEVARSTAAAKNVTNITFEVGDSNKLRLPRGEFDVVHCNMSLHHVANLEEAVFKINDSLAAGGLFVANEFVGPSQFQYPRARLDIVKQRLALLPESLRWDPAVGAVKNSYRKLSRWRWRSVDPTESIRSDEIPRVLLRNFPDLARYDYGGSLLNLVLENIIQNFDADTPDHIEHLESLIETEWSLIETGVIPSDFAYFVCPKGSPAALESGRRAAAWKPRYYIKMPLRRAGLL